MNTGNDIKLLPLDIDLETKSVLKMVNAVLPGAGSARATGTRSPLPLRGRVFESRWVCIN